MQVHKKLDPHLQKPSDGINKEKIAAALARAQIKFTSVRLDSTGKIGSGSFKYSSYEAVWNSVMPHLNEESICFTSETFSIGENTFLRGFLIHESGQFFYTTLPVVLESPHNKSGQEIINKQQQLGKAASFAERYALLHLTGVPTDESDRGPSGGQQQQQQQQQHRPDQSRQPEEQEPEKKEPEKKVELSEEDKTKNFLSSVEKEAKRIGTEASKYLLASKGVRSTQDLEKVTDRAKRKELVQTLMDMDSLEDQNKQAESTSQRDKEADAAEAKDE